jgi:hypothetical protein
LLAEAEAVRLVGTRRPVVVVVVGILQSRFMPSLRAMSISIRSAPAVAVVLLATGRVAGLRYGFPHQFKLPMVGFSVRVEPPTIVTALVAMRVLQASVTPYMMAALDRREITLPIQDMVVPEAALLVRLVLVELLAVALVAPVILLVVTVQMGRLPTALPVLLVRFTAVEEAVVRLIIRLIEWVAQALPAMF